MYYIIYYARDERCDNLSPFVGVGVVGFDDLEKLADVTPDSVDPIGERDRSDYLSGTVDGGHIAPLVGQGAISAVNINDEARISI